jgi:anti-sigma factor RsiW
MVDTELGRATKKPRGPSPRSQSAPAQVSTSAKRGPANTRLAGSSRFAEFTISNWPGGMRGIGIGASFVLGATLALGVVMALATVRGTRPVWLFPSGAQIATSGASLTNQIVASHVRSLMGLHLLDVASTDQHTVKPWFNGKVNFSPPVNDFAAQGYPLIGGRLDYLGGHAVAALVYRHRAHPINVFVWPEGGADQKSASTSEQGYAVIEWRHDGMHFAAVSDVNRNDLNYFCATLQQL